MKKQNRKPTFQELIDLNGILTDLNEKLKSKNLDLLKFQNKQNEIIKQGKEANENISRALDECRKECERKEIIIESQIERESEMKNKIENLEIQLTAERDNVKSVIEHANKSKENFQSQIEDLIKKLQRAQAINEELKRIIVTALSIRQ